MDSEGMWMPVKKFIIPLTKKLKIKTRMPAAIPHPK
jgi:hypothetical protein